MVRSIRISLSFHWCVPKAKKPRDSLTYLEVVCTCRQELVADVEGLPAFDAAEVALAGEDAP